MGLVSRRVRELQEAGEQALKEYMDVVAHEMGKRTGTPYAPDAQPMGLQRRSGRTHASVTTCTMKDTGRHGDQVHAAGLSQGAGVGRGDPGQEWALSGDPIAGRAEREWHAQAFQARGWDNTFIIKSRRGNLLVVRKTMHRASAMFKERLRKTGMSWDRYEAWFFAAPPFLDGAYSQGIRRVSSASRRISTICCPFPGSGVMKPDQVFPGAPGPRSNRGARRWTSGSCQRHDQRPQPEPR